MTSHMGEKGGSAGPKFTQAEAAGLWHAVQWMELCLKQDEIDVQPAHLALEQRRLKAAKSALRKVQAARRSARATGEQS